MQQFLCLKNWRSAEILAKRMHVEDYRILGLVGANGNSMIIGGSSGYSDEHVYKRGSLGFC